MRLIHHFEARDPRATIPASVGLSTFTLASAGQQSRRHSRYLYLISSRRESSTELIRVALSAHPSNSHTGNILDGRSLSQNLTSLFRDVFTRLVTITA